MKTEKHIFKNAAEIRAAVDSGMRVYWSSVNYEVIRDRIGQYLIIFDRGGKWENATGLTWKNSEHLNGSPDEFFTV